MNTLHHDLSLDVSQLPEELHNRKTKFFGKSTRIKAFISHHWNTIMGVAMIGACFLMALGVLLILMGFLANSEGDYSIQASCKLMEAIHCKKTITTSHDPSLDNIDFQNPFLEYVTSGNAKLFCNFIVIANDENRTRESVDRILFQEEEVTQEGNDVSNGLRTTFSSTPAGPPVYIASTRQRPFYSSLFVRRQTTFGAINSTMTCYLASNDEEHVSFHKSISNGKVALRVCGFILMTIGLIALVFFILAVTSIRKQCLDFLGRILRKYGFRQSKRSEEAVSLRNSRVNATSIHTGDDEEREYFDYIDKNDRNDRKIVRGGDLGEEEDEDIMVVQ
ncbi:hypothetical protein FDP41_012776 [Naegleria fowleri]|uniref:Uncharacterized protein n=1 Tax=Naegleria fowleri TaxID=5763 RepID=A0A6A5C568_NAEFO|nr:uncharacterized protein FDP41_012776 [Naegleria fowleri]KAF0980988.1 hypothetical protein FDP41_012776 [Naegleria fowleri]CAG4711908.1 unnamed protein product [Naegleria fowleri]